MESLLLYRHHSIHSYCYSEKYRTFVPSIINTIEDMKKIYLLIAIVAMSIGGYCQKQGNIWFLGGSAGVIFNSGTPQGMTCGNPGPSLEGTASISDSSGNLLFYTNGQTLWNKNYQIMPNGHSLLGNWSSTQSAIFIPLPGNSRYFYLFTVDDYWNDNLK